MYFAAVRLDRWARGALLTVVAATVIAGPTVTTAQQRPPDFRSGTTAVVLDVTVLDGSRRPVRGLSAADFTVLDDGKPQKIVTFSAIDVDEVEAGAPHSPGPGAEAGWLNEVPADVVVNHVPPNGRTIVLVLDDLLPMNVGDGPRAIQLASSVIDRLGPSDLVAVVLTSGRVPAQNFTTDRGKLRAAVARFVPRMSREFDSLALKDQHQPQWKSVAATIDNIVAYLGGLGHRRKAILWVTAGMPLMADGWSGFITAAGRANVTLYPLDPGGLSEELDLQEDPAEWTKPGSTRGVTREAGAPNRRILKMLSESTGGFTVGRRNDPGPQLGRVFAETGTYYLVGFEPAPTSDSAKWHTVDVRVNRPGVEARTRSGYVSGLPGGTATPAPSPMTAGLQSPIPVGDIDLQAGASAFQSGGGLPVVGVVVGVDQTMPVRKAVTADTVEVVVSAYNGDGKPAGSVNTHFKVELPVGTGDIQYEVLAPLALKPGHYDLQIATSSSFTEKKGSVNCEVEVPDFASDPLSLSGVVLSSDPAGFVAPRDALRAFLPVVPTSRRSFFRGERVTAFLRAYQGGQEPPVRATLAVSITDSHGAVVFETGEAMPAGAFTVSRSADYRLDLPLDGLSPGPHLLTFQATAGTRTSRRQVRFEVQ
jgi:VWFA-related protein